MLSNVTVTMHSTNLSDHSLHLLTLGLTLRPTRVTGPLNPIWSHLTKHQLGLRAKEVLFLDQVFMWCDNLARLRRRT
jgi:hypothetical protein